MKSSIVFILFLFFSFTLNINQAQTEWVKYSGNPVLAKGSSGSWDDKAVAGGTVLFDEDIYKMWYGGYDGSNYRIGYATSPDGITWTKYNDLWTNDPSDPVLDIGSAGSWDDKYVWFPCVRNEDSIYKMWYQAYDGDNYRIGYATSPDGISWTKYDNPNTSSPPFAESDPILDIGSSGSWDDRHLISTEVIYIENEYMMFYCGFGGSNWQIGLAKSTDGVTWIKEESHNPVLSSTLTWEGSVITPGAVTIVDGVINMWYTAGRIGGTLRVGYATSTDGVAWNKHDDEPVLDVGVSGAWDEFRVLAGSVYFDGTKYHMWYDNHNTTHSGAAIGYATSLIDSTTEVNEKISVPIKYELSQNYPNPFNPSTIIKYSIPNKSNVILKIFGVLGGQVATIVNKEQPQGNYEVEFDATKLTSGIYFYKLQAGDYVETKKMILLK